MAPSAVSRAVLRSEDELEVRLLQRTTRSLALSEDGNRFYQRAQHILNDLEEAGVWQGFCKKGPFAKIRHH